MTKHPHLKSKTVVFIALCLTTPLIIASTPVEIPAVSVALDHQNASKSPDRAQTTSISRKKIISSPTLVLSDLLQQEQSIVRVTNNTNDNSQLVLSIRGFGDNAFANSLIVVDGFPLTNPSVLAPGFNANALSDIRGIDIIQGSEGSVWGNQAVGGVVKIETLHPEKSFANANVSYGSYNKQLYNVLVGSKFENGFFFKLLGFSNSTDNYRDHNQQTDEGMSWQMGVDYASGSLTLNAKVYDGTIQLPGGLTQAQYDSDPRQASNTSNVSHFQTHSYQLIHSQELKNDWLLETRLSHNRVQGDGFIGALYTREDRLDTINPVLTGTLFNSHVLLGYEGQASSFELQSTTMQQKADVQQQDVYGQVIVPVLQKFDLTLGGRSAQQDNTVTKNIKKAAIDTTNHVFVSEQTFTYHPTSAWDIFIRRDGNFRFAKANELTALPASINTLSPQTGVSYEMGLKWHTPQQTTQLSAYRLQLNNEIAYDPTQTAAAPFGSYSNFDETLRDGVTLAELYHLTDKLTLDGQLNYVKARFAAGIHNGNEVPAVPAINGNLGVNYEFQPNWHVKYSALYTGSRYASQDVANVGQTLPCYWLSAVALQYRRKLVSLSFSVENVFNQRYAVYTIYSSGAGTDTYYPGVGRNFLLSAKLFLE